MKIDLDVKMKELLEHKYNLYNNSDSKFKKVLYDDFIENTKYKLDTFTDGIYENNMKEKCHFLDTNDFDTDNLSEEEMKKEVTEFILSYGKKIRKWFEGVCSKDRSKRWRIMFMDGNYYPHSNGEDKFSDEEYEQMVLEFKQCFRFLDTLLEEENLDKLVKGEGILNLVTIPEVDLSKTNKWNILNDFHYYLIVWFHKWVYRLVLLSHPVLLNQFFKKMYYQLGLVMNEIEIREGVIKEVFEDMKYLVSCITNNKDINTLYDLNGGMEEVIIPMDDDEFGDEDYEMVLLTEQCGEDSFLEFNDTEFLNMDNDDEVTIYRSVLDKNYVKGFSWSLNPIQSFFWGLGRGHSEIDVTKTKNYLVKGRVKKGDILFYNNSFSNRLKSGINEVVVSPDDVNILDIKDVKSDTIEDVLDTMIDNVENIVVENYLRRICMGIYSCWNDINKVESDTTFIRQFFLWKNMNTDIIDKMFIHETIKKGEFDISNMFYILDMYHRKFGLDSKNYNWDFIPQTEKDVKIKNNNLSINRDKVLTNTCGNFLEKTFKKFLQLHTKMGKVMETKTRTSQEVTYTHDIMLSRI